MNCLRHFKITELNKIDFTKEADFGLFFCEVFALQKLSFAFRAKQRLSEDSLFEWYFCLSKSYIVTS